MNEMEEERAYLELIEKGIKMGNVKLEEISLGKSQDGLRTITLADIWTDEKQKEKTFQINSSYNILIAKYLESRKVNDEQFK